MLGLYLFILKQAATGHRSYKPSLHRWGPIFLLSFAIPFIMADLCRHIIQDYGGWAECGNNGIYTRINTTDPYPASCAWSSNQYICENTCCVPTWGAGNTTEDWGSPQSTYFPAKDATVGAQFAVSSTSTPTELRFPAGFDANKQPWRIFTSPLVLDATGTINIAEGGKNKYISGTCKYGKNPNTGYCFLTDQTLSYEDQLGQLNGGSCDCDSCLPNKHESIGHLSPVGIVFTIIFTYTGFILLAVAVMWNADISSKLKKIGQQWQDLRARARAQK